MDLKALAKVAQLKHVLNTSDLMGQQCVHVSWDTYVSALDGCIKMKDFAKGMQVHGHMIKTGLKTNLYLQNSLVNLYTKSGSMLDAHHIFENMAERDVFTWTMMIAGYANHNDAKKAFSLFGKMEHEGVSPDRIAFISILKACATRGALEEGELIHLQIIKSGLELNTLMENSLMDMYAKCGCIENARRVFDRMQKLDIVSWNTMVAGYARHRCNGMAIDLFKQMEGEGFQPDEITFLSILKACANVQQGKEIHGHIIKSGITIGNFMGNSLVDLYVKCASMVDARKVFDKMPQRDTLVWTMMIAGYTKHDHPEEAVSLFWQMRQEVVQPNEVTFVSTLKACSSLMLLEEGKQVHALFVKSGIQQNVFIGNSLIDMYAKCGSLLDARTMFDEMNDRDVVSWNSMIAGYANPDHAEEAFRLYWQMGQEGLQPDVATYLSILKACACEGVLKYGESIHAHITRSGLELDGFVGSALVDMYAKCGNIEESRSLFDKMASPDMVSWNVMIAGYVQHGQIQEAFELFWKKEQQGLKPDLATFLSLLRACACMGILEYGKHIHVLIIKSECEADVCVASSLIDMYAKCGSIEDACEVFDKMIKRDVISWNAMIAGHAQHGYAEKAFSLFQQMKQEGLTPDVVTFIGVLKSCASLGALQEAKLLHRDIIKIGFELDVYVGSTLLDMYAKCGTVQDAHEVFNRMYDRNLASWNAMITGYALHGHADKAINFFDQMRLAGLDADHISFISLLSACSHAGLVAQGCACFELMTKSNTFSPTIDHYVCMVDLLSRAGLLQEAVHLIESMPLQPSAVVWMALLGACKVFGDTNLGVSAAESALEMDPENDGAFVQLSNLYAADGRWEDSERVRHMMKEKGAYERAWMEPD